MGPCSGHWATGAGADRTRGRQRSAGPPSHVADSRAALSDRGAAAGVPDALRKPSTRRPTTRRLILDRRPEPCCCCCCSSSSAPASQVNAASLGSSRATRARHTLATRPCKISQGWAKGARLPLSAYTFTRQLKRARCFGVTWVTSAMTKLAPHGGCSFSGELLALPFQSRASALQLACCTLAFRCTRARARNRPGLYRVDLAGG